LLYFTSGLVFTRAFLPDKLKTADAWEERLNQELMGLNPYPCMPTSTVMVLHTVSI